MSKDADGSDHTNTSRIARRDLLKLGGLAGLTAGSVLSGAAHAQQTKPADAGVSVPGNPPAGSDYPVVDVAKLADLEVGAEVAFNYPDEDSPAVLIRLEGAAEDGIGPDQSIVAFSQLCTHQGCPISFKKGRGMLLCGCHWSSFDPAKGGRVIIGQASERLPQIALRVNNDTIQAVGVSGLIYGRHTNIK